MPCLLYASNNNWVQTDWSGGADTGAVAGHPANQTGWTRFYSKDTYVNHTYYDDTEGYGLSLSTQPKSWMQSADILDFDTGILTNLVLVGDGAYVSERCEDTGVCKDKATGQVVADPNVTLTKTGSWSTSTLYDPSEGSFIQSKKTGDYVIFTFRGTEVTWIGPKLSWNGIADLYLDDNFQGSIDLYFNGIASQQVLWSATGLTNAVHTLKIVVSGTKNSSSSNYYVGVDAFDIVVPYQDSGAYLTLVDNLRAWTQTADLLDFDTGILDLPDFNPVMLVGNGTYVFERCEETGECKDQDTGQVITDPNVIVATTGAWSTSTLYDPSGGSFIQSNTTGNTFSFTFRGTEVTWIGPKLSWNGIADMYLDDNFQGSVDLYYNGIQSQQVLWTTTGLANAVHTVKIVVSGNKNANSSNYYVGVDAFDILVANEDTAAYLTPAAGYTQSVYESPSLDVGSGGAVFSSIGWGADIPAGTSIKFRIATNNDNQTWVAGTDATGYIGPDGTTGSYYVASNADAIPVNHRGHRYLRYRAYFDRTADPNADLRLNDVTISYRLISLMHGEYESPSFDTGFGGALFSNIYWNPVVPPSGTTLKFRIATNNDNQTWTAGTDATGFIGPDGTAGSYYETSGADQIPVNHSGHRYIKYRAYFDKTLDNPVDSPTLDDVTINYMVNPSFQALVSSPYDTADSTNVINRWMWSEDVPANTDVFLQLRTSSNSSAWSDQYGLDWYGPHNTTFSASSDVNQITVASTAGFQVGSRVTLTNSANDTQFEVKTINAIDSGTSAITLDSATSHTYSAGSVLSDSYTDPAGTEVINPLHKSGNNDRWIQYRVFLFTTSGTATPVFRENKIGYFKASAVYQPDGVIDGDGGDVYGASGSGGASTRYGDPGFILQQPVSYDVRVQNDGNSDSVDDTFTVSWNSPSDASGNWTVYLNDGVSDLSSPVSVFLNANTGKTYTLKVTPSQNAPGDSSKDIILDIFSDNDYTKTDSLKATTIINRAYQVDGLIDGYGDNQRDSCSPACTGIGGQSALKEAAPGDIVSYDITLQNEGNMSDTYTLSLLNSPPVGWSVLLNDGTKDYDITNLSVTITGDVIPPPPQSNTTAYTLKVIPKGDSMTADIILLVKSEETAAFAESLTAKVDLKGVYKVDGTIYGVGYDAAGNIIDDNVMGSGCSLVSEITGDGKGDDDGVCEAGEECYNQNAGDNIYGALGSGAGGCTAVDIDKGASGSVTLGIQNEGNLADRYKIVWSTPTNWSVKLMEDETLASPIKVPDNLAGSPPASGKCIDGSPCYNPGDVTYFVFKITTPTSFTSGSQTIIFDVRSRETTGDKYDSVKAIVNSGDTTPPAAAVLSLGSVTATSVKVSWSAPGDNGSSGTAKSYDLRYSTSAITDDNFAGARMVGGCQSGETILRQPKSGSSSESCTVTQLFANTDYYFALKTTDDAANVSAISTCSSPSSCMVHTGSSTDTTAPGAVSNLNAVYTRVIYPMDNPAFAGTTHAVSLQWTAKADDGNTTSSGPATAYDLRYSTRKIVDDSATAGAGEVHFSETKSATVLFRYDSNGVVPVCLDGVTDLAQLDQAFIANQGELLPPKSPGGAECYTVIVDNRINTGGNIIDDRTQNTRFYFAAKALDERGRESSANISSISNVAGGMTNLVPYAYNMVSVPYIPNPNTPDQVFGDDVGTPLYAYSWKSSGPNVDNGCYDGVPEAYNPGTDTCTVLSTIKEGPGYFLWAPYGNYALDVPSSSLPSSASASYSPNCDDGAGGTFPCYQFTLSDGWNMIGTTFDEEINLSDRDENGNSGIEEKERGIYVRKTKSGGGGSVEIATFQSAVTARNWIDNDIFTYNGINYTYEICDQDKGGGLIGSGCPVVMQPWKGYWIRVHGGGGATFELLIPE